MGKGYKHGTSGKKENPLNFTVKTYPSETELKADKPKENTIGIITTTTMPKWVFSATEPKEPEVGMVWICVGKQSKAEFNALKENTLQVYPISAKQYVGGKFEDKIALSYQNGAWVEWWNGELYDSGDEYVSLTGGWAVNSSKANSSVTYAELSVSKNADNIVLECSSNKSGCFGTVNPIDLTDVEKVYFKVSFNKIASNAWSMLCVHPARSAPRDGGASAEAEACEDQTFFVDVKNLSGLQYITFALCYASTVTVKKVWTE